MPELPEVETVVRGLRPHLCGRRIQSVKAGRKPLRRPWRRAWSRQLSGCVIRDIRRRGKWIILDLDPPGRHLVAHLGMTGQLRIQPAAAPRPPHTHLVFELSPGGWELRFRDVRRFGSVCLHTAPELERFLDPSRLGAEPFALEPAAFQQGLQRTRRPIKAALLDQRLAAGVGNIYADEALHEARLLPTRLGLSLSPAETERLRKAIVKVLRRAIERKGSTIRDFVDGNGQGGGYQREFRVYQRAGLPCRRCGGPIQRLRLAGRSTHYCPICQT